MSLPLFRGGLASVQGRRVGVLPKTAATIYQTPEFKRWREAVVARAGRQCEAIDDGVRCRKGEPRNRMFADHVVEVRDGGAPFDIGNGQCLCGAHHTAKTARVRAARRGS